jgi:hypothetical protein
MMVRNLSASRRPGARRGSLRWAVPVVVAGAAAVVAGVAALSSGSSSGPPGSSVHAYDAAIAAPVQHWGKIATLGMRAALGDLQSGQGVPRSMIAGEARAWQGGLDQVRTQMRAVPVPPSLHSAASRFDQALQAYLDAARLFEQAADGRGDVDTLVRQGVGVLGSADCAFDDAAVDVQQALRNAGLPADAALPDEPCSAHR